MGQAYQRRLPPRETPFFEQDGRINLDWYAWLRAVEDELGGTGFSTVLRSPARGGVLAGASAIAGALGTVTITIDGNDYNLVHE